MVALPALLARTGHLRRVDLAAKTASIPWDALNAPLRHAIEALFRQPSITYVRLAKWTFESWDRLSALFRHTPHLRGLALRDIEFMSCATNPEEVEEEEEEGYITPPRPEFVTLDYVDCNNLDHWPGGPMDMTQIREFRLGHSDALGGDKLLHACGRSLERFHLKPGSGETESLKPAPISLRHCSNLRSLRLTLEDYPDILGWVVDMISSITVSCTLEHVAIEFFIDPKKLTRWDAIDGVLSRFDSLKQVAIGVFAQHTQPEFLRVQDDMAGLRERGVLRVYELARRHQNHKMCSGLTPMISSFEQC
ncbi:hypothetical protein BDZ89DRAFT_1066749 [Hymenopellis radicata]|nr:hypothetical protein BDZ89DRAFT_1066749 [Hymenopellis radicata]